jgi:urease accessory protein
VSLALTRLLQLASPALPVGAYTYSQGLEWAVEAGLVRDESGAQRWIADLLAGSVARFELPALGRLLAAWRDGDEARVAALDARYLASRETAELRAETRQMGHSLRRLLNDLDGIPEALPAAVHRLDQPAFITVWSGLAAAWEIPAEDALCAWAWSWAENQTMAAIKTVPLGQAAGQRILQALGGCIPAFAAAALRQPEDDDANFAPGFAIACACHETQYTRLFRS